MLPISEWRISSVLRLDSCGALLSAGILGLVLPRFESMIGMPRPILWPLAFIALGFCLLALLGSFRSPKAQRILLFLMIVNNSIYSLITLVLVGIHWRILSPLGVLYFLVEIIVVGGLVSIEIQSLRRANAQVHSHPT